MRQSQPGEAGSPEHDRNTGSWKTSLVSYLRQ
jgi:hypothetical protein